MKVHTVDIAGFKAYLPILTLPSGIGIAFFNLHGDNALTEHCGKELAKQLADCDVLITAESKGIPLAYEMARQRGGSIINMTSVVGLCGNAGQCNYAASKAGLIGLAKSIAKEMGPRGIRCNCIAPGFIVTDMTSAIPEEMRAEWAKTIPLRRAGTPEDVANVALFLGSDMSAYVSGQVINCCGAMSC